MLHKQAVCVKLLENLHTTDAERWRKQAGNQIDDAIECDGLLVERRQVVAILAVPPHAMARQHAGRSKVLPVTLAKAMGPMPTLQFEFHTTAYVPGHRGMGPRPKHTLIMTPAKRAGRLENVHDFQRQTSSQCTP